MKAPIIFQISIIVFLLLSNAEGCMISDDEPYIAIDSTNWENDGPDVVYNESENYTIFEISGIATLNNPYNEEIRVTHNDGCGWKLSIAYAPNDSAVSPQVPIKGPNIFCPQVIMPLDYPPGKTRFNFSSQILFPGNLDSLPVGYYDISMIVPKIEDNNLVSVHYLISAEGEIVVMRADTYCGSTSEEKELKEDTNKVDLPLDMVFVMTAIIFLPLLGKFNTNKLKK